MVNSTVTRDLETGPVWRSSESLSVTREQSFPKASDATFDGTQVVQSRGRKILKKKEFTPTDETVARLRQVQCFVMAKT